MTEPASSVLFPAVCPCGVDASWLVSVDNPTGYRIDCPACDNKQAQR